LEKELWSIFRLAAAATPSLILVVDGLDEMEDVEDAVYELFARLATISSDATQNGHRFKCIISSRPLQAPFPSDLSVFDIDSDHNSNDVSMVITASMDASSLFGRLKSEDKILISEKLNSGARGMFLWADLMLRDLQRQKSLDRMLQVLENTPKELEDLYLALFKSIDVHNEDSRRILLWLWASRRPLMLGELKDILETDEDTGQPNLRLTDVSEDILELCGPLVKVQNGTVQFAHLSVSQFMTKSIFAEKFGWTLRDGHQEIAKRSLVYLSFPVEGNTIGERETLHLRPDMTLRDSYDDLCGRHGLLDYAIRFWAYHLKNCLYESDETTLAENFTEWAAIFPRDQALAWIEDILWAEQEVPKNLVELHELATKLRMVVFHKDHMEVIQSSISLAKAKQELLDYVSASQLFRACWKQCRSLVGDHSPVTYDCAQSLIQNLEYQGRGRETEDVYHWKWKTREEDLGPLDECCIELAGQMAWMYHRHGDNESAIKVYRETWTLLTKEFGLLDERSIIAAGYVARTLENSNMPVESQVVYEEVWDAARQTLSASSELYLSTGINVAHAMETNSSFEEAEKLLLYIQSNAKFVADETESFIGEQRIGLELVKFYGRRSENHKALGAIERQLINIKEFFTNRNIVPNPSLELVQELGQEMGRFNKWQDAADLLDIIWQYRRKTCGDSSLAAVAASYRLAQILGATDRSAKEDVLKRSFEFCAAPEWTGESAVRSGVHLGIFYQSQNRLADASQTWSRMLTNMWPEIMSDETGQLPEQFREEAITTARRLSGVYEKQGKITDAKAILEKVFKSCKLSLGLMDSVTSASALQVAQFLESKSLLKDAERIYNEVWQVTSQKLGASNLRAIEAATNLAKFYQKNYNTFSKAANLYSDILRILTTDWGKTHSRTIETSLSVASIFEKQKFYRKAEMIYSSLWTLFKDPQRAIGPGLISSHGVVHFLYDRLLHLYSRDPSSDKTNALVAEYPHVCTNYYGPSDAKTLKAYLRLGKYLEQQGDIDAAIELYAEILREGNPNNIESSPSLAQQITARLLKIYGKFPSHPLTVEAYILRAWQRERGPKGHNGTNTYFKKLIAYYKNGHIQGEVLKTCLDLLIADWEEKKQKAITPECYWIVEDIAQIYVVLDREDGVRNVCQELFDLSRSPDHERKELSEKAVARLKDIYRQSNMDPKEVYLLALRSELNGVRIGLSKGSPTRNHSNAIFYLPWDPSDRWREEWENWNREYPAHETTTKLGLRLADRISVTTSPGQDFRAYVLQQVWQNNAEAFGLTNARTVAIGMKVAANCQHPGQEVKVYQHILGAFTGGEENMERIDVEDCMKNLATAYCKVGQLQEARDIFDRLANGTPPETQEALEKLAELASTIRRALELCQNSDDDAANDIRRQSVHIMQQIIETLLRDAKFSRHMLIATTRNLRTALAEDDRYGEIEEIYLNIWNRRDSTSSWRFWEFSGIARDLSEMYFATNRQQEAIDLMTMVARHDELEYGVEGQTVNSYDMLSSFHSARHEYQASLGIHEKLLDVLPKSSRYWTRELNLRGRALQRLGRWQEATSLYIDLWRECQKTYGTWVTTRTGNIRQWNKIKQWVEDAEGGIESDEGIWKISDKLKKITNAIDMRENNIKSTFVEVLEKTSEPFETRLE
jgi:tetratricopeptide (TPR) repeat protein